jgi:thioredoxin reductase
MAVLVEKKLSPKSGLRARSSSSTKEVVIVGAGPYGLSAAAFLQNAGVDSYVIGQPMAFWKRNMPPKMLLRSRIEASNIASPTNRLTLDAYQNVVKRKFPEPLPIEDFIAYGEWFQKQVAPDVDERPVRRISHNGTVFVLSFEDGEEFHSKHVILATGIGIFSSRPKQFADIPREFIPHTSELSDLSACRGKRVAVLGTGQSALEYAALLRENGADVMIISRSPEIKFRPFAWKKHLFRQLTGGPLRGLSHRIIPPTDLGDVRTARKMADPNLFRRQSPETQEQLIRACTRPIGAYWLAPRLKEVNIRTSTQVSRAGVLGPKLTLDLSDGTAEQFDMVVLATGYKVDVSKYEILDSALRQKIGKTPEGYPVLSMDLQTSIPGLYMAGVVAEKALGPTLRFVTGTSNAGPRLAASITKRSVIQ